jgi:hypothetical protein
VLAELMDALESHEQAAVRGLTAHRVYGLTAGNRKGIDDVDS